MKAVQFSQFGGPEVLELVESPDPHPGPGQIRVAVRAAGINPIDRKVRSGAMGGDLPQGTGREVAGVVDEVGERCRPTSRPATRCSGSRPTAAARPSWRC